MSKKKSDNQLMDVSMLELYTGAYEYAMKEINELTKEIIEEFRKDGVVSDKVAKEMGRERWLLGGLFLAKNKDNVLKVKTEIIDRKQREKEQKIEEEIKEKEE